MELQESTEPRLTISTDKLGHGFYGTVYLGRLKLRGKRIRVAVKVPHTPLKDNEVDLHRNAIEAFKGAGLPVPRTEFIKHEGRWVQVMHLFGSKTAKSKIGRSANDLLDPKANLTDQPLREPAARAELIEIMAKIANLGYWPTFDSISHYAGRTRRFLVTDFDAYGRERYWGFKPTGPLNELKEGLTRLAEVAGVEHGEILAEFTRHLTNPRAKDAIRHVALLIQDEKREEIARRRA